MPPVARQNQRSLCEIEPLRHVCAVAAADARYRPDLDVASTYPAIGGPGVTRRNPRPAL
ncbi:MAG: hypothetical protein IPK39_01580 [Sulfuritalea sp.]|nr:hypothetical protein [Sulfuritalea sp.]